MGLSEEYKKALDKPLAWDPNANDPARLSRTHAYGYVTDEAYCALKMMGCLGLTTSRCHGVAACIQCLTTHGDDVRRGGGKFEYVGSLEEGNGSGSLAGPANPER